MLYDVGENTRHRRRVGRRPTGEKVYGVDENTKHRRRRVRRPTGAEELVIID